VTPFEDEGLERAIEKLAGRLDYTVGEHDVILKGSCPVCQSS
jgi:Fur family ferric uptake transcriptional regulator